MSDTWTVVAAVAAILSAIFAWISVMVARRQNRVEVIRALLEERYTEDLRKAKIGLLDWKRDNGDDFATEFAEERETRKSRADGLDDDRHRVFMYFRRIYDFKGSGLNILREKDIPSLINDDDIELLIDLMMPIENAIRAKRTENPCKEKGLERTPLDKMQDYFEKLRKKLPKGR